MTPEFANRLLKHVEHNANCDDTNSLLNANCDDTNSLKQRITAAQDRGMPSHSDCDGTQMPCNSVSSQETADTWDSDTRETTPLQSPRLTYGTAHGFSLTPGGITSRSHDIDAELDALGDVLDWLAKSSLGSDQRFIPPDCTDELMGSPPQSARPSHSARGPASARELLMSASGGGIRAPPMTSPSSGLLGLRTAEATPLGSHKLQPSISHKLEPSILEASASCWNCGTCGEALERLVEGDLEWRNNLSEEEVDWILREERTGSVGRLVVYEAHDEPHDDFILRGGYYGHFVVATVRDGGPAARAGVRNGDRLASINGKKDFVGMSATEVRMRLLHPPSMVVFLGFVGKLHAEVRVSCSNPGCGLSLREDVARGYSDKPLHISSQIVFHANAASLFLVVDDKHSSEQSSSKDSKPSHMFELRQCEAHELLDCALNRGASEAEDNLTVNFSPGAFGCYIRARDGTVTHVFQGQAQEQGVKVGMRMTRIGGQQFSDELLQAKMKGTKDYEAVFLDKA